MLIDSLSTAYHQSGKPVIVLLNVPAPIETASWRDQVDAILLVGQPGERAGESIADALTGTVAPSGRLADTWPVRYGDALADKNFPSEVGQLYVSAPAGGMDKPVRELKGFAKTRMLAPGESETMEIPVSLYDIASWNERKGRWETAKGAYHFCFGKSAEELLTDCQVRVKNCVSLPKRMSHE